MPEQNVYPGPTVRENNHHPALALNGITTPGKARSMELHVFLRDAVLPTREEWQAGIIDQGFGLRLDEALDLRHTNGFCPASYWGRKSGFEFNLQPAIHVASRYQGVLERIGARDVSADFRWSGNALESVIVYIASAVIARLADGILYFPQKNHFSTGYEAIAMAKRLIKATELD